MGNAAVVVGGLGKRYRIGARERYSTLRDRIAAAAINPFRRMGRVMRGESILASDDTMWALRDTSFEIARGEVLGVIGRNGAGKTTLLKILARVTEPTESWAEVRGRVDSLLEVGTGFHPELTGRENVFLSGAILGMSSADIRARFDEIVEFAEVRRHIDTPIKHYSTGMYLRLAFAVAAHLEPEVLLVDEVLAVGDASFQERCLGRMGDVARAGRTILFVSHNMAAIEQLSDTVLWIDGGRVMGCGEPSEMIRAYLDAATSHQLEVRGDSDREVRVDRTRFIDADGDRIDIIDLTPQNGSRDNLTIWVEEGRSECRRRGTAQSRSYGSYGRLRWSWPEARRSRMPAAS